MGRIGKMSRGKSLHPNDRTMRVAAEFHKKVQEMAERHNLSAPIITRAMANQLIDANFNIKINVPKKKGGFSFFK